MRERPAALRWARRSARRWAALLLLRPVRAGGAAGLEPALTRDQCVTNCHFCPPNPWYVSRHGVCGERTDKVAYFYELGWFCHSEKERIRDPKSCGVAHDRIEDRNVTELEKTAESALDYLFKKKNTSGLTFYMSFSRESGCHVRYSDVRTPICFGKLRVLWVLLTQAAAMTVGAAMACCSPRALPSKERRVGEVFEQGAKYMVVHTHYGCKRLLYLQLFRFAQVVANIWFPMVALLKFNPLCVCFTWILLYFLPTLWVSGREFLSNLELINAPYRCSLLGLRHSDRPAALEYLFSALRPVLFSYTVDACIRLAALAMGREPDAIALNQNAWFRAGMAHGWEELLLRLTVKITHVCTLLHMVTASLLVLKQVCCPDVNTFSAIDPDEEWTRPIRLKEDAKKIAQINAEVREICSIIEQHPSKAREKIRDEAVWTDDRQERHRGVEPESKFSVCLAAAIAVGDFASYIWSIATFLRRARYFLAMVLAASLWESFFVLLLGGHLQQLGPAFRSSMAVGVQSADFRALIHWDDGIAGTPALMCKVYGLAQAQLSSFVSFFVNAFFMISSTRAMAVYLIDEIDMDVGICLSPKKQARPLVAQTPLTAAFRSRASASSTNGTAASQGSASDDERPLMWFCRPPGSRSAEGSSDDSDPSDGEGCPLRRTFSPSRRGAAGE